MCAQCAFVALAAIGTYSAFHNQIRARVDKALGIDDAELVSIAPLDDTVVDTRPEPLTAQRSITFAIFLVALSQLRHRQEPRPVASSPFSSAWDSDSALDASAAGD
jgi:hypothetical protein